MERDSRFWALPLIAVVGYPGVLLSFDAAINSYHASGSALTAVGAVLTMVLAGAIPMLPLRALLIGRHDAASVLARVSLFVMFATPSLFSLTATLSRLAGVRQPLGLVTVWICMWLAVGLALYLRNGLSVQGRQERSPARLRVVHGVVALALLVGFLLPHLTNHFLAAWSVELHGAVLKALRLWYRSAWVEPVLLALLLVMIATGFPMVLHYARQRMDAFRVVQAATGAYVMVFISSHVVAVLNGRRLGLETDWSFAAGPASLLDGTPLLSRLIPHYIFGVVCVTVHVASGLRIVLLNHGVTAALANRALYGLASVGVVVAGVIAAALLGVHVRP